MSLHSIDNERRLYCLKHPAGYTTLGFDYADKQITAVAAWLGQTAPHGVALGTAEHYALYESTMAAGAQHATQAKTQCSADLTPQLVGLEHSRVEVVDCYGEKRQFIVGKSTGWMPCHLEIAKRTSTGGGAVTGAPFKSVRVVGSR